MLEVDTPTSSASSSTGRSTLSSRLRAWELPLVLTLIAAVAGFLRFYQISTTEFDEDQAMLFRLAQDAVHHVGSTNRKAPRKRGGRAPPVLKHCLSTGGDQHRGAPTPHAP